MIIYHKPKRIILIHENDEERDSLNKLVADAEKEKELMIWWGDEEYNNKEIIAVNISTPFSNWGSQGGKKKGITKMRGDSKYYKNLAKKGKS